MGSATLIRPDVDFTNRIVGSGGEDLRKCYQCATCTTVCELSPEDQPFPRKEVLWAQWGLKDRLLGDSDLWLCHNCGDCSVRCPRGANPGSVMAAIRRQAIIEHSFPRFFANWVNRPTFLPILVLIPALLLSLALAVRDPIANFLGIGAHHGQGMEYANLFPHWLLIAFFTFFLTLSCCILAGGVIRFWKTMRKNDQAMGRTPAGTSIILSTISVAKEILTHRRFGMCSTSRQRQQAHLGIFYGFLILFLVSGWAVILLYILNPLISDPFVYPFPLWNPAKVIANLGAFGLVAGCMIAIGDRIVGGKAVGRSSDFDWHFLIVLLLLGLTGIATETLRYLAIQDAGYAIYFVHLILAFMLLSYLPFSKFAHIVYRTVALIYAEYSGRGSLRKLLT